MFGLFGGGKKDDKPDGATEASGILSRLKRSLGRTREVLTTPLGELFAGGDDDATWQALETALVRADLGGELSASIVRNVREARRREDGPPLPLLRRELLSVLAAVPVAPPSAVVPRVVFFVGVNGTGKTTSIAKFAARSARAGERPVMVACDTFRAAAIEQLATWADRAGVPMVRQGPGADPASVLHDALTRARERGESPVLVDTAGRLHVKTHLMEEMAKMSRVAGRLVEGAPHDAWLVLDATTGQNGLMQAREFGKAVRLTGVVLTKLDGTAKGGVAFAIAREFGLPIVAVGVGESLDDLLPFDAEAFVDGLLGAGPAPA